MLTKIKNCPFCGGNPIRDEVILPFENDKFGWRVMCEDCGCVLIRATKSEVIRGWNTRIEAIMTTAESRD